jgi:hypothetical protein
MKFRLFDSLSSFFSKGISSTLVVCMRLFVAMKRLYAV